MTTHTDQTTTDNTSDNRSRLNMLNNPHTDKLHNPGALPKLLVYMSVALSLMIPAVYFVLFVYPTMMAHSVGKTQLVSIPLLTQQLEQLKGLYKNSHATLIGLEADISSVAEHDAIGKQYDSIDLHRLAYEHQLTIVAMDTLNEQEISPRLADYFTAHHLSWHFKGYFFDYLEFRKALWEKQPLLQAMREHLSTEADLKLNIIVDFNIYRPIEGVL